MDVRTNNAATPWTWLACTLLFFVLMVAYLPLPAAGAQADVSAAEVEKVAAVGQGRSGQEDGPYEVVLVTLDHSVLHPFLALAVEVCSRGHTTFLVSHAGKAEKKVRALNEEYSEIFARAGGGCGAVQFLSLGHAPITPEEMVRIQREISASMSKMEQMGIAMPMFEKINAHARTAIPAVLSSLTSRPHVMVSGIPAAIEWADLHSLPYIAMAPTMLLSPFQTTDPWVPAMMYGDSIDTVTDTFTWRFANYLFRFVFLTAQRAAQLVGKNLMPFFPAPHSAPPTLITSAAAFDYAQRVPPSVVYTGPWLRPIQSALSDETARFVENVPQSGKLVYISMGTVVWLRDHTVTAFLDGLLAADRNTFVVWALPDAQRSELSSAVQERIAHYTEAGRLLARGWVAGTAMFELPQLDLFVTHCGSNSVHEALWFGNAVLGIPHFGDQYGMCARVADAGAGSRIHKSDVSAETVAAAKEIAMGGAARSAATRLSRLLHMSGGVQKATDIVEYAAEFGTASLRQPVHALYWWQAECWDAYFIILAALALTVYATLKCVCCVCCRARTPATRKQKAA
eukprot:TRINITY_DN3512_c2_g1_i1.p1 TRINITY_DN3512_c2_g1~~TRINITY_DN3512_c2_g1_i1.p1  ORF type:complete len:569 (-),score=165.07 TRINITY_DN3512_c2_g1_i1:177-1883(-)